MDKNERNSRTAALIGAEGVASLASMRVLVIGLGGVGGYATEALARAGVGALTLVDCDRVTESNINRQIIADYDTVGRYKTDAFLERISKINPDCTVTVKNLFVTAENVDELEIQAFDYVIDAIDTVSAKIALAVRCEELSVPLISSMGTGNKLDPTAFEITDIYKTSVCPLARVMRCELKKRGVRRLEVLYSKEPPSAKNPTPTDGEGGKRAPASISFVPSAAGLIIAGRVIKKLAGIE